MGARILGIVMAAFLGLVLVVQLGARVEESAAEAQEGARAKGTLTLALNPGDGETVTLDSNVYTFETTLTDVDGNVHVGATVAESRDSLICAIRLRGCTAGTDYAASMTEHPTIYAYESGASNMIAAAKTGGTAGNALVSTETLLGAGNVFDDTTLGATQLGTVPQVTNTLVQMMFGLAGWVVPLMFAAIIIVVIFLRLRRGNV